MPAGVRRADARGAPGEQRRIGQGGGGAAEGQALAADAIAHGVGADLAVADDGAAAHGDGHDVRHAEVRADAADLHVLAGLAREAVDQHADVRGGAAHVDDDGVRPAGQVRGAAEAVRRAGADGENREPQRVLQGHQRAVVLGEEEVGADAAPVQGPLQRARHVPRHAQQGAVEDGGVLSLDQAQGADLVGHGQVDVVAHDLADHLGGGQLVAVAHRGEDAGDGHRIHRSAERLQEPADLVRVERDDLAAVQLDAAVDHRLAAGDDGLEVRGPGEERADRERRRGADAHDRHAVETLALQHGVGGVGGAQHDVADAAAIHVTRGEDRVHRVLDALGHVRAGGGLRLGQQAVVAVQDHGVRVGAAHVDADAEIQGAAHASASPLVAGRSGATSPGQAPTPASISSTGM